MRSSSAWSGSSALQRPHVEAEAAEVDRPGHVRDVGDDQRVGGGAVDGADLGGRQPRRARSSGPASGRTTPPAPFGIALEQHRPTAHRPHQRPGDRLVVADEVELGLAALGEEDLVRARDRHLAPGEVDRHSPRRVSPWHHPIAWKRSTAGNGRRPATSVDVAGRTDITSDAPAEQVDGAVAAHRPEDRIERTIVAAATVEDVLDGPEDRIERRTALVTTTGVEQVEQVLETRDRQRQAVATVTTVRQLPADGAGRLTLRADVDVEPFRRLGERVEVERVRPTSAGRWPARRRRGRCRDRCSG